MGPADRLSVSLADLSVLDIAEHGCRGLTPDHMRSLESKWRVILRVTGNAAASSINYDVLRAYEGERRAQGVKGQTIVREMQAMRRAIKIGIRKGLLSEDDMPKEWPKVRRNAADVAKSGKLRKRELLLAFVSRLHGDAQDEVLVDLLTGLRSAELKRFKFDWVEPAPPGVPTRYLARIPSWASKTRRERVVGLPEQAAEIIARRAKEANGGPIFSQKDFKRHRTRVSADLGCEHTITLRDLRHSFATYAMQATGDPNAVLEALGHSDLSMTKRYLSSPIGRVASAGVAVADMLKGTED